MGTPDTAPGMPDVVPEVKCPGCGHRYEVRPPIFLLVHAGVEQCPSVVGKVLFVWPSLCGVGCCSCGMWPHV